jgi:hypothetical protein
MIITELYNGQGLGNQLWCYVVTRIIAQNKGYDFGIKGIEKFKGSEFLDLYWGGEVIGGDGPEGGPPHSLPANIKYYYKEKLIRNPKNSIDISKRDDILLNIPDNTKIDGIMQSYDYVKYYKKQIKDWIQIKSNKNILKYSNDDICIIHIRGGDFLGSSAFLQEEYYRNAMDYMREKNPNIIFYIVTDDVEYAKKVCPDIEIIGSSASGKCDSRKAEHHMGGPIWMDWTIIYNAKNLIISASSFSWWPTWLGGCENIIAPMYWGDYKNSDGYWSCGDSLIPGWKFLNRQGQIKCYDICLEEKEKYEQQHYYYWS